MILICIFSLIQHANGWKMGKMGDNQVDTDGDGRPDRWYWGFRGTSAAVALMT